MSYETTYTKFIDHPHYLARAQWIKEFHEGMTGNILEIGSGYGFLIKHLNDIGLVGKVSGLEPDEYPISKMTEVGVSQYIYNDYVQGHNWILTPLLDLVVSWNVLDSLPNEDTAINIANILNTKVQFQIHVLCCDVAGDNNCDIYKANGLFIKSIEFWKEFFTNDGTVLVDNTTGNVWVNHHGNWSKETGWKVPLSWGKVSD